VGPRRADGDPQCAILAQFRVSRSLESRWQGDGKQAAGGPSAPSAVVQNRAFRIALAPRGALGEARPTFLRAGGLGSTPGSRRHFRCGEIAPTAVGGYILLANRATCEPSGLAAPSQVHSCRLV